MLEIRWHSRAGQGAVTGAKGLADVIAGTGKEVQAFATYGSAKRGATMAAFDRFDDSPILNHEKYEDYPFDYIGFGAARQCGGGAGACGFYYGTETGV